MKTALSSQHYARSWSSKSVHKIEDVTRIGIEYSELSDGDARKDVLLKILQIFHPYLLKYLGMIRLGSLTLWKNKVNKDSQAMLAMLLPKGGANSKEALMHAAKSMHFSFKSMDPDEIYNMLVVLLTGVVRKYDPHYALKIREVCEWIETNVEPRENFQMETISEKLGYDVSRCFRHLRGRGFITELEKGTGTFLRNEESWPPPKEFFRSGVVGFTHYVQQYFRFALEEHITNRSREIEAKEHVVQLHTKSLNVKDPFAVTVNKSINVPHQDGWRDTDNNAWAADTSMMTIQPDITRMTIEWVNATSDPLFSQLERSDRYLLYLMYTREMPQIDIAETFGTNISAIRNRITELHLRLRKLVAAGVTL